VHQEFYRAKFCNVFIYLVPNPTNTNKFKSYFAEHFSRTYTGYCGIHRYYNYCFWGSLKERTSFIITTCMHWSWKWPQFAKSSPQVFVHSRYRYVLLFVGSTAFAKVNPVCLHFWGVVCTSLIMFLSWLDNLALLWEKSFSIYKKDKFISRLLSHPIYLFILTLLAQSSWIRLKLTSISRWVLSERFNDNLWLN